MVAGGEGAPGRPPASSFLPPPPPLGAHRRPLCVPACPRAALLRRRRSFRLEGEAAAAARWFPAHPPGVSRGQPAGGRGCPGRSRRVKVARGRGRGVRVRLREGPVRRRDGRECEIAPWPISGRKEEAGGGVRALQPGAPSRAGARSPGGTPSAPALRPSTRGASSWPRASSWGALGPCNPGGSAYATASRRRGWSES